MNTYINSLPPQLSKEESDALWLAGEKQKVIEGHLRLVVSIAYKYKRIMPFEDLVQEGNIGVIKAAEAYDPKKGASFYTYASMYIKHSITEYINRERHCLSLPKDAGYEVRQMEKAKDNFVRANRREPTVRELARETKLAQDKIKKYNSLSAPISMNTDASDEKDGSCEFGDLIPDKHNIEDEVTTKLFIEQIRNIAGSILTETERFVFLSFCGFDESNNGTASQIAKKLQISDQKTYRVMFQATNKIREYLSLPLLRDIEEAKDICLSKISKSKIERCKDYILKHSNNVGGQMTQKEMAKNLGVSNTIMGKLQKEVAETSRWKQKKKVVNQIDELERKLEEYKAKIGGKTA